MTVRGKCVGTWVTHRLTLPWFPDYRSLHPFIRSLMSRPMPSSFHCDPYQTRRGWKENREGMDSVTYCLMSVPSETRERSERRRDWHGEDRKPVSHCRISLSSLHGFPIHSAFFVTNPRSLSVSTDSEARGKEVKSGDYGSEEWRKVDVEREKYGTSLIQSLNATWIICKWCISFIHVPYFFIKLKIFII